MKRTFINVHFNFRLCYHYWLTIKTADKIEILLRNGRKCKLRL